MAVLRVLGIMGSPRPGGNTDLLLDAALKGAEGQGARVEKVMVDRLNISPCREHYGCLDDGLCVIRDDMDALYPRLLESDCVLVASPIFFYGLTAQLKALIDRCQALWARKHVLKQSWPGAGRKGAFLGVGASTGGQLFDGSITTVRYFFKTIGVEYSGELLVRGVDRQGDVLRHPSALPDAFELGARLARRDPAGGLTETGPTGQSRGGKESMTHHLEKSARALETALQMEAEGKKFYLEAAARGGTPVLVKFFQRLAADEDQHAARAREIYDAIKASQGWPEKETTFKHATTLKSVLDEAFEDMDADPAKPSEAELEAFKNAMAMEDRSYTFDKARLEEAGSTHEKSFYKALTGEERMHYLALLDSYEYLSNPQGWFSRTERWGLDG